MRAAVLNGVGEKIRMEDRGDIRPGEGEVVVRVKAAALNRRDVWIRLGKYAGLKFPIVLGSDGVGEVEHVGIGAESWAGKEVIIDPALGWGGSQHFQNLNEFQILGLPRDGTFAEQVLVPAVNLAPKPEHLSRQEAAALPLAGVTAFRALSSRAKLVAGEKVLVTGAGGGTATFAVMFAVAMGAEVYVTSGSEQKICRAVEAGVMAGVNYREDDWDAKLKSLTGGFDVIIDSTMGPGFSKLVDLANPGGRIAFFGATAGDPPEFSARKVFWKQLSILGATMGSPSDFAQMLNFVNQNQLKPVIDKVYPLEQANEALDRMQDSAQFGKIVLDLDKEAS